MLSDISIDQDAVLVSQNHIVLSDFAVESSVHEVEPVVQIFNEEFVLASGGMYSNGNGLIGAIPTWILDAIREQLTTGSGNITQVLYDLQAVMSSFQIGITQTLASLNTSALSQSSITTTLASQVDANRSEVLNLIATKVTPTDAQAIAVNAIHSTFGTDASAFVGGIASTYVDANSAIAQDVNLISATLNGLSASVNTIDSVVIKHDSELAVLSTDIKTAVAVLQSQVDGAIDSWYYSYVPTQDSLPWSTWISVDNANLNILEQSKHLGDLFYNLLDGTAYRFVNSNGIFGWATVTDTAITLALAKAANAQSTADGKATIYYKTSMEMSTIASLWSAQTKLDNIGDTWVNSATNVVSTWNGYDWINAETTWSVTSAKVLTGADGSVMGWEAVNKGRTGAPAATTRAMTIVADTFKIVNSSGVTWVSTPTTLDPNAGYFNTSTAYTPFSIVGSAINFNGRVNISNFADNEKPIVYLGTFATVASLPTVGIVAGSEGYVTAYGYYVFDGAKWNLRVGTTFLTIIESTNGDTFRVGLSQSTLLIAHVFSNGVAVTDSLPLTDFRWRRLSKDTVADALWNIGHLSGYKQISVGIDDVQARATFFCDIISA